jgi:putative transposase
MREKRAYHYRCYPTATQAAVLARIFGCARYVYNWGLRTCLEACTQGQEYLSYTDLSAKLTTLKQQPETAWLAEVSSVPLQQALRHLDRAFVNYFAHRAKYPKFKKKRGRQAITYVTGAFSWDAPRRTLKLAKMDAPLAVRWSRSFPEMPTSVTVSCDSAGRYFVSFLVEEEIAPLALLSTAVGVDLGLHNLVVFSSGEKVANPKHLRKAQWRLRRAHKNLSRKPKGSRNRAKAQLKLARCYATVTDQRTDGLHKVTTRLIRENQTICVESLAVKHMVRNRRLARAISDAGWGELVRQLEYKARWYERRLIKVDRWYPSSKQCSDCGHILDALPLKIRRWTCPTCGADHDRDVNAAQNVLSVATVGPTVSACGETVRPTRASACAGRSH